MAIFLDGGRRRHGFLYFKILRVGRVQMRRRAKFRGDRSNHLLKYGAFLFFNTAAVAMIDFQNVES